MKWSVDRIRTEIARLDEKTGLNGRSLPIRLNMARCILGQFFFRNEEPREFCFSSRFFEAEDFSCAEALDVIAHEYAHYMDCVLNGKFSDGPHGESWKECCRIIGARPFRYYMSELNQYALEREKKQQDKMLRAKSLAQIFCRGKTVHHPAYGTGEIVSLEADEINQRINILFADGNQRLLDLDWVGGHCTLTE